MFPPHKSNIRRIFSVSITIILLSGCWAISVPESAPDSYHDICKHENLIGTSILDVINKLGYPSKVRENKYNKRRYLIYKDYGSGLDIGFFLYVPIIRPEYTDERSIHCLLIEIDKDYLITDIKLKSVGVGPAAVTESMKKFPKSCVRVFWSTNELSSYRDVTEMTLLILKKKRKAHIQAGTVNGDLQSAIILAEEFGDTTALEAMSNNNESLGKVVSYIAEQNNLQVYYKLREHNPELANKILCKAVEQGYCEAYTLMGAMYSTGYGVTPSKENAYVYYKLAEKMKCADCCKNSLDYIREWLSTEEINHAERLLNEWEIAACKIELDKSYNNKTTGK